MLFNGGDRREGSDLHRDASVYILAARFPPRLKDLVAMVA